MVSSGASRGVRRGTTTTCNATRSASMPWDNWHAKAIRLSIETASRTATITLGLPIVPSALEVAAGYALPGQFAREDSGRIRHSEFGIRRLAQSEPSSAIHVARPARQYHYADRWTPFRARPVAVYHHQHLPPQPTLYVSALLLDRCRDSVPARPKSMHPTIWGGCAGSRGAWARCLFRHSSWHHVGNSKYNSH